MVSLTLLKVSSAMDNITNTDAQQVVEKVSPSEPLVAETLEASQPLRMNSRGEEVRRLQKQLLQLGFLKGGLDGSADGILGAGTRAAVQAFQQSTKLEADGIVGPITWLALQELSQEPFAKVDSEVYSVAISPDILYVISALANGNLQLKSLRQGEIVERLFQGHQARVLSVKFSPDGKTIVSGSADKTIRLWDVHGRSPKVLQGHEDQVWAVAYSPDGQIIASSGRDRTVRLWDLEGNLLRVIQGHTATVSSVVFSPNGLLVASSSEDNTIRLWDLEGNPIGQPFKGHTSYVSNVAFRRAGDILASSSIDNTVRLWDLEGNSIGQPFVHEDAVNSIAFINDQMVVSGSTDKTIRVWNISGTAIGQPLKGHTDTIWSVSVVNSEVIISGSRDHTLRLWNVKTGKQLRQLPLKISVGQELENDLAQGDDRLNVKTEINALTNLLMLRDLKPPLAVGILGGWGSGKSFALHLMKQRINEIRSEALTETQAWGDADQLFPYVGHVYQIEFDAWTYAKSNLWASLMQKVFLELNRQISLEQKLKAAKVDLLKGGKIWKALNSMSDEHRRQILESHLTPEIFKEPDLYKPWIDIEASQRISSALWERLGKLQQDEIEKLGKEQEGLIEKQNELSNKQIAIEIKIDQKIRQESRALLWKPLSEDLLQVMGKTFEVLQLRLIDKDEADKVKIVLEELEPDLWQSLLKTFRRKPKISTLFFASLLLLIATPWLLTQLNGFLSANVPPGWFTNAAKKVAALLTTSPIAIFGIPFLREVWNGWKRYRKQVKQVLDRYQKQVLDKQEELAKSRQVLVEIEKSKDTELIQLEEKFRQQQAHVEQQKKQISLATNYKSLNDLIDARLQTDPYSEQLGLLQQVKGDIEELTDRLVIQNGDPEHIKKKKLELFPRGPARVVLYIDDLDRCPPNKVVEVLEAVQLLVKTSLFIVVLAIDDRYIARALEEVYKGVLKRRGEPSGIDYLEKIIQIPYRMRPISASQLKSYLEFQMKVEEDEQVAENLLPNNGGIDSATTEPIAPVSRPQGVTDPYPVDTARSIVSDEINETPSIPDTVSEVIKFSRSEVELLTNCCKHVDLSPRTAKRLINIYKILKIVWSRYPSLGLREPQAQTKQVAIALLALSGRYPNFTRHLFEEIDTQFEELSNADDNNAILTWTLTDLLKALYQKVPTHDHHYQREWRKFTHDIVQMLKPLQAKDLDNQVNESSVPSAEIPSETSGDSLSIDRETFYLALSFCFVGDIGYDPDDYHLGSKPNF